MLKCVKDFRPISLIDSIYKILARVLVVRIQKAVPGMIPLTQGAFVQGGLPDS